MYATVAEPLTATLASQNSSTITVNRLIDGEYQSELFRGDERIRSMILPQLELTAMQVFAMAD